MSMTEEEFNRGFQAWRLKGRQSLRLRQLMERLASDENMPENWRTLARDVVWEADGQSHEPMSGFGVDNDLGVDQRNNRFADVILSAHERAVEVFSGVLQLPSYAVAGFQSVDSIVGATGCNLEICDGFLGVYVDIMADETVMLTVRSKELRMLDFLVHVEIGSHSHAVNVDVCLSHSNANGCWGKSPVGAWDELWRVLQTDEYPQLKISVQNITTKELE